MEARLGMQLFVRKGRRLVPNAASRRPPALGRRPPRPWQT
ncbi:LysR family transcriptional regulator [Streptomyces sp. NPDC051563]